MPQNSKPRLARLEAGFAVAIALWIVSISAWAIYGAVYGSAQ
jgi:hypothetical protein